MADLRSHWQPPKRLSAQARSNSLSRKNVPPIDNASNLLRGTVASANYHYRVPSGQADRRSFPECLRSGSNPTPTAPHNRRHSITVHMQSHIPLEPSKPPSVAKMRRPVVVPHLKTADLPPPPMYSDESEVEEDEEQPRRPPRNTNGPAVNVPADPLVYFERLERRIDEIMSYIRDVTSRIDRLESEMQSLSQRVSPDFEKRLLLSVSTAIEDKYDSEVLANRMVNAIVPGLERWWTSKLPRGMIPLRAPVASPPTLMPSCSPGGQKRGFAPNRAAMAGRTPGAMSLLTDSLSFSENGTEWGGGSQMFCTPNTTMPIQRANVALETWEKNYEERPKDNNMLNATDPPTLNPIKEDKSPSDCGLSRETTTHATPLTEKRAPQFLGNGEETPIPSSKGHLSPRP